MSSPETGTAPIRNLAKYRAAWHSSAADINHTAHLVTDGIYGAYGKPDSRGIGTEPAAGGNLPQSAWHSGGGHREWIRIDLGAVSVLHHIDIHWGTSTAERYDIQIVPAQAQQKDATVPSAGRGIPEADWQTIATGQGQEQDVTQTPLNGQSARHVRILCHAATGDRFIIREVEILGSNRLTYTLADLPAPTETMQPLTGGNWRVQRASEVPADGAALCEPAFDDSTWLPASVPDTILVSYLKAGAIPDPNYDDWQDQISDSFFTADFWYRNHFDIPVERSGRQVVLAFDALNWKADVFFNGHHLNNPLPDREKSVEGGFIRGQFPVTPYVKFGQKNVLAVRIYANDTPEFGHLVQGPDGPVLNNKAGEGEKIMVSSQGLAEGPWNNGGRLGLDSPTFHSAIGWDWIPTVRGRDIGLYNDVCLRFEGPVALEDPWMITRLSIGENKADIEAVDLAAGCMAAAPSDARGDAGTMAGIETATGIESLTGNGIMTGIEALTDGNTATDWVFNAPAGSAFTLDLGRTTPVGCVVIRWGEVPDTAAYESQNARRFRLESSVDGQNWQLFDAYPGGEIEARWFGPQKAAPYAGTDSHFGQNVANSLEGPTGRVVMDLREHGAGMVPLTEAAPAPIRYLRFTTLEWMTSVNSAHGSLPPKFQAIQVYAEPLDKMEQSMVRTYRLDDTAASLTFRTEVRNHTAAPVEAVVSGTVQPGGLSFSKTVTLAPLEVCTVEVADLTLRQPRLWWPNTYGEPFLYTASVSAVVGNSVSASKSFRFGVREFTCPIDGNRLTLFCNGTRIVARGGNWGMDDALKLDRAQAYDDKVRLTAEANLVMIRNWVGQTHNEAFYDACDKYGNLVWDDFSLANPADGPDPNDEAMFIHNAMDKTRRFRHHASLALYCGRNEANPPPSLDEAMRTLTAALDGTRIYLPNSAAAPVGSGGGYALRHPRQYFDDVPDVTLRSEMGIPNIPDIESIHRFLEPEHRWPVSEAWALHDFTFYMNGPANTYVEALTHYRSLSFEPVPSPGFVWGSTPALTHAERPDFLAYKENVLRMLSALGQEATLKDFSRIAQMINYDHHRAMFEGLSVKRSNGALMWMSQSSFPSFMWQTYDYFLATNGGYFGLKAACQPTHAVLDPRTEEIVLANATPNHYPGVTTTAVLHDLHGRAVSEKTYQTGLLGPDSYGIVLDRLDCSQSATDVVFLRLTVRDGTGDVLGDNLYWYNRREYQNYRALGDLPQTGLTLTASPVETLENGHVRRTFTLANPSGTPALQARLVAVNPQTGDAITPVFWSDNYLCLMPGESRAITAEHAPTTDAGGNPVPCRYRLDGWNVAEQEVG
jgi:hypothetical protein